MVSKFDAEAQDDTVEELARLIGQVTCYKALQRAGKERVSLFSKALAATPTTLMKR